MAPSSVRSCRPGDRDTVLLRPGTFDADIWTWVSNDYPTLPARLHLDDLVLDIGCHTGAFAALAARRGATVIAYEAALENYALACVNVASHAAVEVRRAAVWRSDRERTPVRLTPHAQPANTGGGSVLFASAEDHWAAIPDRDAGHAEPAVAPQPVATVALDDVLDEVGPVRFLKIDAEGAEFPILLTSRRLDLVEEIAGEYHELTTDQRARLAPEATIGELDWSGALLRQALERAGFAVSLHPTFDGRGLFSARRRRGSS